MQLLDGVPALLDSLPPAKHIQADRGYDAERWSDALEGEGLSPCILSRNGRKVPIPHNGIHYRQRPKIENGFAQVKDWHRVATRYDAALKSSCQHLLLLSYFGSET